VSIEQNVRGFDIPVNHSLAVSIFQGFTNLAEDKHSFGQWRTCCLSQSVKESGGWLSGLSFDEFENQIVEILFTPSIENPNNSWVRKLS
jgi:hypothetical protein